MFKTETHLHTKESSWCGWLTAEQMLKAYSEAGYGTVCITDHFMQAYFNVLGDIPWHDKVTISLHGYFRAKYAAEKYGINVILAPEFEFEKTSPNHYLVFGITREFLDSHPDICKMSIEEFSKIAKENNLFIIQAHPFRDGKNFPTPDYVDAIEICNSNPRHDDNSEKSKKVAKDNNLCISGGSDAHRPEDIGLGGIITETEIRTAQDLIDAIKSRKVKIIGA